MRSSSQEAEGKRQEARGQAATLNYEEWLAQVPESVKQDPLWNFQVYPNPASCIQYRVSSDQHSHPKRHGHHAR